MAHEKDGHVNWKDQISSDSKLDEDIKRHPGFGKPLPSHLFSGDVYSNFVNTARNAGYLPPFAALRKDIYQDMEKTLKLKEENFPELELKSLIEDINEKIKKYNASCPPMMQKGRVSLEGLEKQMKYWE